MKEKAAHRFHGRRGGGFVPDGAAVLDHFPQPVAVTCDCKQVVRWWVIPADVDELCWGCGVRLEPEQGAAA